MDEKNLLKIFTSDWTEDPEAWTNSAILAMHTLADLYVNSDVSPTELFILCSIVDDRLQPQFRPRGIPAGLRKKLAEAHRKASVQVQPENVSPLANAQANAKRAISGPSDLAKGLERILGRDLPIRKLAAAQAHTYVAGDAEFSGKMLGSERLSESFIDAIEALASDVAPLTVDTPKEKLQMVVNDVFRNRVRTERERRKARREQVRVGKKQKSEGSRRDPQHISTTAMVVTDWEHAKRDVGLPDDAARLIEAELAGMKPRDLGLSKSHLKAVQAKLSADRWGGKLQTRLQDYIPCAITPKQ